MTTDLYENFAQRYDLDPDQLNQYGPQQTEFFRQIISRNNIRTILDCACGTGRHLLLFQKLGCEVSGSDISAAMLAQARINLANYGIEIPLKQADYRDLPRHFQRNFDAVVCLGSIGYMPNETEFVKAFCSMYTILRPGGFLVLTTIPTDKEWVEKPRFTLSFNTPNVSRLFVMDYFERTVGYNILDIYHSQEASELKVWRAELTIVLKDAQERLLKTVGFRKVDFYGAFDFSPYHKTNSDHLITVAQK